jgi:alkanesulfonate monooxygenase SsuD/methylene tetrahydromethanopterin reductase-like flavin-dependent oxidoreductase (luciferase family)
MRFTYAEAMTQAKFYAPLAQAAEAAGYTSMTVADSLIYPKDSDSKYPYTDTGDREFLDGKEFIETMVLCAHLFAVTTTLRLTPFVLKLPVRPPVLVAKQASSLAFLSDNRLGLGVGISPWPEDFANLGVDWAKRGKRMDECMDILRGLTTGEFFKYDGEFYEVDELLVRLAEIRKEEGDTRDDFEVHVISYDAYDLDGIKRLEDKGVTDCIVGFRVPYIKGPDPEPLDKKVDNLNKYAESIIHKVTP